LRRAPLAARPLAARGDGCHHRDRELRLAKPGLARNQRQLAEGDAAGPQPLDRLGFHVRRASRDQLGTAGATAVVIEGKKGRSIPLSANNIGAALPQLIIPVVRFVHG